jgi:hypothetical protein
MRVPGYRLNRFTVCGSGKLNCGATTRATPQILWTSRFSSTGWPRK